MRWGGRGGGDGFILGSLSSNMEARPDLKAHRQQGKRLPLLFFGHYKKISKTINKVLLRHVTGK